MNQDFETNPVGTLARLQELEEQVAMLQVFSDCYQWLLNTQNQDIRWSGDEGEISGIVENIFVCRGGGHSEAPDGEELHQAILKAIENEKVSNGN